MWTPTLLTLHKPYKDLKILYVSLLLFWKLESKENSTLHLNLMCKTKKG